MIAAAIVLSIASAAPVSAPRNACQLLTPADVRRVQGEAFQSTKLTESNEHGLEVSQCFYALPSFGSSVSVDVMRGKALEFWRERFASVRDDDEKEEARGEPESAPRPVHGVGDAAVWSGNRLAGALYVLRGDTVLRVSVGGPGTADEKIARSKKLAVRALRTLER